MVWHPLLAAVEREPAVWTLVDELGRDYARIRLTRHVGVLGYEVEPLHDDAQPVERRATLRGAVEAAHLGFVQSHGPQGAANGGAGYTGGLLMRRGDPS